mmetsp:Transcript_29145/g.80015  ORF Transcript_29145/g.80015 Transcript_29145/m.80015 type:complete len:105 (-) Transcript_29145:2480-2794(-)
MKQQPMQELHYPRISTWSKKGSPQGLSGLVAWNLYFVPVATGDFLLLRRPIALNRGLELRRDFFLIILLAIESSGGFHPQLNRIACTNKTFYTFSSPGNDIKEP